ncbi:MAG: AEC family transporter [Bacillota bacterium]|nr:AEC family transporter [Bacillota bacterium]
MSDILNIILPVFLVIGLGLAFRRLRILSKTDGEVLSRVAFYIALPALLFQSISTVKVDSSHLSMVAGAYAGYILISLVSVGVALLGKAPNPVTSAVTLTAANGNHAYVGLPVVTFAYGSVGTALAAYVVGLLGPWVAIICAVMGSLFGPEKTRRNGWAMTGDIAGRALRNPLMISVVAGLLVNWLGLRLPLFLDRGLTLVGQSAAPIGLLAIGANIDFQKLRQEMKWILFATALRLFGTTAVVWGLYQLLPLSALAARVGALIVATPAAVTSYVTVREVGGHSDLAAGIVVLTTFLSPFTMALVLYLLGH